MDETKAWIHEKDTALSTDDHGRDLAGVQALQRKHEALERDLAALEDKVNGEGGQERSLCRQGGVKGVLCPGEEGPVYVARAGRGSVYVVGERGLHLAVLYLMHDPTTRLTGQLLKVLAHFRSV